MILATYTSPNDSIWNSPSLQATFNDAFDSEESPLGFSWQREMMSRDRVVDWRKNYSFTLIVCIDNISFTVAVQQIDASMYQTCCENSLRNCMIRIFWFLLIDVERTNRIASWTHHLDEMFPNCSYRFLIVLPVLKINMHMERWNITLSCDVAKTVMLVRHFLTSPTHWVRDLRRTHVLCKKETRPVFSMRLQKTRTRLVARIRHHEILAANG